MTVHVCMYLYLSRYIIYVYSFNLPLLDRSSLRR